MDIDEEFPFVFLIYLHAGRDAPSGPAIFKARPAICRYRRRAAARFERARRGVP